MLDINATLDLLGVVLTAVGTGASAVQKAAREEIAALFNSDHDVVFEAVVRHSEATAQATRERALLAHELDAQVRSAPKWYEIRRGTASAQVLAPRTASSVADDLFALTNAIVSRLTAAEQQERVVV